MGSSSSLRKIIVQRAKHFVIVVAQDLDPVALLRFVTHEYFGGLDIANVPIIFNQSQSLGSAAEDIEKNVEKIIDVLCPPRVRNGWGTLPETENDEKANDSASLVSP